MRTRGSKLRYYRLKSDPTRAPAFGPGSNDFAIQAADGTRIAGTHLPSAAGPDAVPDPPPALAFVLVHGLFAHRRLPSLLALAESLTAFGPVWTIDLRGHGTSGGACTLGEEEALDVAAATAYARAQTPLPIVTIGLSMGAAAAIRAAVLHERPDAVVSISGPSSWLAPRPFGAWKTSLTWRLPGGPRLVERLSGFRLAGTIPTGPSPLAAIPYLAPTPVLVVHGTLDPFFRPWEAQALHGAAHDPRDLWLIEGGGHAESLFCTPGEPVDPRVTDAFAAGLHRRVAAVLGDQAAR